MPQAPAGRRRVAGLVAMLGGACAMGALATDLFQPVVPAMAADLHAPATTAQLTVSASFVGLALGQLTLTPLSDSLGRRRLMMVSLGLFAGASVLCAVAPSVALLLVVRVLQGFGAQAGVGIANAVVADYYRGREAARVLSRLVLVSLIPPVLGPPLGAQLLGLSSWRSVFVAMALIGAVLLAAVALWLRESLPPERRAPRSLRTLYGGLGRPVRDAGFMGVTVSAAFMWGAFFAYLTAGSFVIQEQYGASPVLFGFIYALNGLGMMAGAQLNHVLLARFTPRGLLLAGTVLCLAGGTAALAVALVGGLGLVALEVPLFVTVFSVGLSTPNATALALSRHRDAAGAASAGYGAIRLTLATATTPLVGVGGAVAALPMAVVMTATGIASLGALGGVWRRLGGPPPDARAPQTPGEAADDVAVG